MPIGKSLEGLRSLIAPSDNYKPSIETFPQLDIAEIERSRGIRERGEERGKNNTPAETSTAPDPVESELLEIVQYELAASNSRYLEEQVLYDERLQKLNFQGTFAFVDAAVAQAVSDFRVEGNFNSNISLVSRRKRLADAWKDLTRFQAKNRIERTAKYPNSAVKILQWGIVALLFLIEAVVNGAFLRKGGGGWIGGISTAIAFAFVNIVFSGVIANYGIREIFHRNFLRKFVGLISVAMLLVLTLTVNTVLANYREVAMDLNATNVEQSVVAKVADGLHEFPNHLANLYSFQNIETFVLLLIGILFAIIVMIDVLKFDDLYPGYGDVDRRYQKQLDSYEDEVVVKIEDLQALRDEATDTLDKLKQQFARRLEEYQYILTRRRALYQHFLAHLTDLQRGLDTMVRDYRQANIASRSTPAPSRFDRSVVLPKPNVIEPLAKEEDLKVLNREFEKIVSVLTSQASNLHSEFEKAATNFKGADEIMLGRSATNA